MSALPGVDLAPVAPTLPDALGAVLGAARACLLTAGCTEDPLPSSLATVAGSLRGETVVMRSQRFVGGAWSQLVLAEILGERSGRVLASVIGLPARGLGDSVLGVDLVAFGGKLSLAAVDLSPIDEAAWSAHSRPALERLHAASTPLIVERARPTFTHHTFSSLALVSAARPGDDVALLGALARWLPQAMAGRGQVGGEAAWATQQRWRQSERNNRKEADGLARLFGADFARGYVEDFLFPVDAPQAGSGACAPG
jgi:hypothetical protein